MTHKEFENAEKLVEFVNEDTNNNTYIEVNAITQDTFNRFHLFYSLRYSYREDGWFEDEEEI